MGTLSVTAQSVATSGFLGRSPLWHSGVYPSRAQKTSLSALLHTAPRTEDDPPGLACFTVRPGGDFHILIEHGQHAHLRISRSTEKPW
jgi:hypothetical protein